MFEESLKIHILDITKGLSLIGTVSEIFDHYIHIAKGDIIDFSKLNVMIEEWTGWTKLNQITRKVSSDNSWAIITPSDAYYPSVNDVVICLDDTVIPVYDPTKSKKGFHGEIKYKYNTVSCRDMVSSSGYFRMRRLPRTNAPFYQHIKCSVTSMMDDEESVTYSIFTKSGFFNGNNFHLCSSDTRIEDEKELWK